MDTKVAFHILQIEVTKDEAQIRNAYRQLLQITNPEDDQEGFKKLRVAYEVALEYSRSEEETEEKFQPVTDIDFYIERIEKVYKDIRLRFDTEIWKDLLDNPLCEELDTSTEVRERVMIFLMNHIHISHEVWKLLDKTFELISDMDNLRDEYPANFLAYVQNHIENEDIFPYEALQYTSDDIESSDPDAYLDTMMQIKREIDDAEFLDAEENIEILSDCKKRLNELEAYGVYHSHTDVEKLRIANYTNDEPVIKEYCEKLMPIIEQYRYVALHVGEAIAKLGDKEKAYEIWKQILENNPQYYRAKYNVVLYLMDNKKYNEARKTIEELMEIYDQDDRVFELLKEANVSIIEEFQTKLKNGEEDEEFPGFKMILELGWCLLQNDRIDEAIKLLEDNEPVEDEDKYGYTNLFGRTLYQNKQYERALPYLERWIEILVNLEDDGTEKTQQRLARKNMAYGILAGTYFNLQEKEKAIDAVNNAIKYANDQGEKLNSKRQLASMYLEWEEFEKVVDICDEIIMEEDQYYPAYIMHQQACYELKKAQEVVDDYHKAVDIYAGYYKPYLLATEVFFYYDQFEDSLKTIKHAEDNGVELSPKMLLFKVKILRNLANNNEDRKVAFDILDKLEGLRSQKESDPEKWDIDDDSEILYERGLLYWDSNKLDEAQKFLELASKENPSRAQYDLVIGNFLVDNKQYNEALSRYRIASKAYSETPALNYGYALCYEGLMDEEKAIEHYQKVLEERKVYNETCEKLSDIYTNRFKNSYDKSDFDKAIEYISRQVEETPHCYFYVHRGLIYLNALELDAAIADFEEALKLIEDDWAAWNNLGCCYKYKGEFAKAIDYFEKAIECLDKRDLKDILPYSNMADCYEALGDYDKAIGCYLLDLKKMDPNRFSFYEDIGNLQAYLGRFEDARESYKKCGGSDYYSNVAYTWLRDGKADKAIDIYINTIDNAEEKIPKHKSKYLRKLGMIYVDELGDPKEGIKYLKKAYRCANTSEDKFDAARYLARAYFWLNDRKKAKQYAQEAVKFFASYENVTQEAYMSYKPFAPVRIGIWAWIELCLGNTEKAIEMMEDMDNHLHCRACRYRKCYEKSLYLADVYNVLGETEKAKQHYEETIERDPSCIEAKLKLARLNQNRKKGILGFLGLKN